MKKYSSGDVAKAFRKEAKKWQEYAEQLLAEQKAELSEIEAAENEAEYAHARNWQNMLSCIAFEIEQGNILE